MIELVGPFMNIGDRGSHQKMKGDTAIHLEIIDVKVEIMSNLEKKYGGSRL